LNMLRLLGFIHHLGGGYVTAGMLHIEWSQISIVTGWMTGV